MVDGAGNDGAMAVDERRLELDALRNDALSAYVLDELYAALSDDNELVAWLARPLLCTEHSATPRQARRFVAILALQSDGARRARLFYALLQVLRKAHYECAAAVSDVLGLLRIVLCAREHVEALVRTLRELLANVENLHKFESQRAACQMLALYGALLSAIVGGDDGDDVAPPAERASDAMSVDGAPLAKSGSLRRTSSSATLPRSASALLGANVDDEVGVSAMSDDDDDEDDDDDDDNDNGNAAGAGDGDGPARVSFDAPPASIAANEAASAAVSQLQNELARLRAALGADDENDESSSEAGAAAIAAARRRQVCTYAATGSRFTKQHWY